jgi:hypothetical protein
MQGGGVRRRVQNAIFDNPCGRELSKLFNISPKVNWPQTINLPIHPIAFFFQALVVQLVARRIVINVGR